MTNNQSKIEKLTVELCPNGFGFKNSCKVNELRKVVDEIVADIKPNHKLYG